MLEIKVKRRRWLHVLVTIGIVALLAAGSYVLLTVFAPTMPVLSGRAPDETKEKLLKPAGTFGNRLFIPQINVDVAIYTGRDASVLEKGAWHRKPENGDPVHGGNFVLSAHRFVMSFTPQGTAIKSPFYNIGRLAIGDRIFVDFEHKRYQYEISEKYTVKPDGVEVEAPTKDPQLTLYSCTLQGSSDGRDVLEAKPVNE
jgi:LPXTG-site transpeptidase (sortase) family protein